MADRLALAIRTPHRVVLEAPVRALRVPTETGLAGIRPRGEPMVVAVEPGLVVLRDDGGPRFAATAGGLLASDRDRCTLFTPEAVVGSSEQDMLDALDTMRAAPGSELAARRQLGALERRIVRELGHELGPGARAAREPRRQHGRA